MNMNELSKPLIDIVFNINDVHEIHGMVPLEGRNTFGNAVFEAFLCILADVIIVQKQDQNLQNELKKFHHRMCHFMWRHAPSYGWIVKEIKMGELE